MTKFLTAALITLTLPMAASASSINLSSALVQVNKDMGIASSNTTFGAGSGSLGEARSADGPCFGNTCGNPISCTGSPENPTALLAVLGATGLLLGRIGYGRLNRRATAAVAAA